MQAQTSQSHVHALEYVADYCSAHRQTMGPQHKRCHTDTHTVMDAELAFCYMLACGNQMDGCAA